MFLLTTNAECKQSIVRYGFGIACVRLIVCLLFQEVFKHYVTRNIQVLNMACFQFKVADKSMSSHQGR